MDSVTSVPAAVTAAAFALWALLAGCATTAPRGDPQRDEYLAYAGAPLEEFHFFRLYDWQRAGKDRVVLWTDPGQAYLVTVMPPCVELDFSEYLGVSSTVQTVSRFESLFPGHRERCPITEIRPLDVKRLAADRAAARAARAKSAE